MEPWGSCNEYRPGLVCPKCPEAGVRQHNHMKRCGGLHTHEAQGFRLHRALFTLVILSSLAPLSEAIRQHEVMTVITPLSRCNSMSPRLRDISYAVRGTQDRSPLLASSPPASIEYQLNHRCAEKERAYSNNLLTSTQPNVFLWSAFRC